MNKSNVFAEGSFEDQVISLLSQLKSTNKTPGDYIVAKHVPFEQTEAKKERYIEENSDQWQEIGLKYKQWRESQWLSKAEVARSIGVAPSTLTKFEEGQPCKIAKTIQAGYEMFTEIRELRRLLNMCSGSLDNMQKYADNVEQNLSDIEKMIKSSEWGKLKGLN